jgi:hypothetical protein
MEDTSKKFSVADKSQWKIIRTSDSVCLGVCGTLLEARHKLVTIDPTQVLSEKHRLKGLAANMDREARSGRAKEQWAAAKARRQTAL